MDNNAQAGAIFPNAQAPAVVPEADAIIPADFALPVPWRNRPRRRTVYTQRQRERAIYLRSLGYSFRQIATRIGPNTSPGTMQKWVRRENELRRQRQ